MITNFIVPFSLFHPPPLCPSLGPVVVRVVISSNANGDGHRDGLALAPLSLSLPPSPAAGGRHRSAAIPCTRSRPLSLSLLLSLVHLAVVRAGDRGKRPLACLLGLPSSGRRYFFLPSVPRSFARCIVARRPSRRRMSPSSPPRDGGQIWTRRGRKKSSIGGVDVQVQ